LDKPYTLILFTSYFPYDFPGEQTFLKPEMKYLSANFDRVIIVPEILGDKMIALPPGNEVEGSYALFIRSHFKMKKLLFRTLFSRSVYKEGFTQPSILFRLSGLRRLAVFAFKAELTRRWVCDFIQRRRLDPERTLFYTYWLIHSALGIGLAKKDYPPIKLVSRAHNFDLFEEQYHPAFIPYRPRVLNYVDRLFTDSENGRDYIANRYPRFAPICEASRLGVSDPGFHTSPSKDNIYRIVSCSFVRSEKRIDLLIKGINCAARLRPVQPFEWSHIGDGPLKKNIEEMASRILPANVRTHFMGYLPHKDLMLFYQNHSVDLFANTSEYEGIPVSVMEVISCGIPVIATAVCGNPEIVSDRNGKLLSSRPTPEEIASTILKFLDHPDQADEKRKGSRKVWEERFRAEYNYPLFAGLLRSLVQ
jgi:colanic acid/amylovoran biosynthesis glycosyltransferase